MIDALDARVVADILQRLHGTSALEVALRKANELLENGHVRFAAEMTRAAALISESEYSQEPRLVLVT